MAKKKVGFFTKVKKLFVKEQEKRPRKKGDVRKIYKTTDGYFTQNSNIRKKRRVAVVDQRKKDGALAVTKIYSKEGKSGKAYVENVVLKPEKHSSLTKDSIVGSQVIIGTKGKDKKFNAIYKGDLDPTGDELTKKEHRAVKKAVHSDTKEHRETYEKKMQKWHKQNFNGSKK